MNYNPSYTLQPSPSPSESVPTSSASPAHSDTYGYLPPLPIPPIFNHSHHLAQNPNQRQIYPTSSPYQPSPDPTPPLSKLRLPPPAPTSFFTNGYASPATSGYSSSEPGSRDEIDMMEAGSLGGSGYHGGHGLNQPGIDGMMFRGDGIRVEKQSSRKENRDQDTRKRWNMRDFTLMQTVGNLNHLKYL